MAGCFGGSAEDRYFEKQLNDHLNSLDFGSCNICGETQAETQCSICNQELCSGCKIYDEENDIVFCPQHHPECGCGEETLHKCDETGEYCCGPDKHNCDACIEGENPYDSV